MRKFLVFIIGIVIGFQVAPVQAATSPSRFLKLSEVDCQNEWIEIQNTNSKLGLNLKNYKITIIETDGSVFQNKKTLGKQILKPGARLVLDQKSLGFGIACGDESVVLTDASGKELDRVAIPNMADKVTWARFTKGWFGGNPTLGKKNTKFSNQDAIDQAAWIYDVTKTFRINLTITAANQDKLVANPKTYVPAKFRFVDLSGNLLPASGALRIGVRQKGSVGSTNGGQVNIENGKIGLKLKFNEYVSGQQFLGLKRMTLNNMLQDPSMVHEVLAYKLFTDMGLIAPRTGFATVYLNGASKGLYLNLESYDEIMMARHRNSLQHMYDATWAPGYNQFSKTCISSEWHRPEITVEDFRCNFEIDRGSTEDVSDLEALANALNGQQSFTSAAKKIIDIEQVAKFLAVEKYINHWDGYSGTPVWTPNNFRLFSDAKSNFELLPWGTDGTWQIFDPVPDWLIQGGASTGAEPFGTANGKLFTQCLADSACKSIYLESLTEIATLADYSDYAQIVFDAQTEARVADVTRMASELDALWAFNQTLNFIDVRAQMATNYVNSQ